MIYNSDCLIKLKELPSESIDCCITSPPYYSLRDYGVNGQLGLENTYSEYIDKLCDIFDEIHRILRSTGVIFVNIGDTYNSHQGDPMKVGGMQGEAIRNNLAYGNSIVMKRKNIFDKKKYGGKEGIHCGRGWGQTIPDKCLLMIPFRFAIEMVNRGWILRNTIIWHKRNCMPSSAKDRFTVDFEYVFFFVKSKKYWFETQYEPHLTKENRPDGIIRNRELMYKSKENILHFKKYSLRQSHGGIKDPDYRNPNGRIRRCVWTINTKGYKGAHFAVFPEALVEPMIQSGCPEFICKKCGKARKKIWDSDRKNTRPGLNIGTAKSGQEKDPNKSLHNSDISKYRQQIIYKQIGYTDCDCNAGWTQGVVFDPFCGAGTTGVVAKKLNRNFIGIELNPEYVKLAENRILNTQGSFL